MQPWRRPRPHPRGAAVLLALALSSAAVAGAEDRAPTTASAAGNLPVLLDTIRANRKVGWPVNSSARTVPSGPMSM